MSDNPSITENMIHREAEEGLIGSIIISEGGMFYECSLELSNGSREFWVDSNRWIWDAIEEMLKEKTPLDIMTLSEQLQKSGKLDKIGGAAYLTKIISKSISSLNAVAYAKIVHDRYIRRRMITAATETAKLAYDLSQPVEEAAVKATSELSKAISVSSTKNSISIADSVKIVDAMIEENSKLEELPGIATPWVDYNKLLGGGAQKTDLNIIAARPGKGKTTCLMQIAIHAAKYTTGLKIHRNNVVIFSLEMPHEQLTLRLLASLSGIDFQVLRAGKIPDNKYADYYAAIETLSDLDIQIDCKAGASPAYIRTRCEMLAASGKLDLVCIDSLNLMRTGKSYSSEFKQTNDCAEDLQNIGMDFNVPIWCTHQMSRRVESRSDDTKPMLSDLRDGGEQPAAGVMFIWHEFENDVLTSSSFIQAKHRNGPTGEIPVVWIPKLTRFESAAVVKF